MLLRNWRNERDLSLKQVADAVCASAGGSTNATVVSRWERGVHVPNRREMSALFLLTGGKVTPNDFYELPQLSEQTEQAA